MYSFGGKIRYSECDKHRRLTVPMLLNYFQDCSTMHSEEAGVGMDYLQPMGLAWVLNFWQVDILRRPMLGEQVVVSTFPYERKGALGFRNYMMQTPEGERLAVANTLYSLIETRTLKMVTPDEKQMQAYQTEEKLEMEYLSRKILFEDEGEKKQPFRVLRHQIDANDHVNNVQYVSMALDLLPAETPLRRLLASYHISAVYGDTICPVVHREQQGFGIDLQREDGKSYCKVRLQQ